MCPPTNYMQNCSINYQLLLASVKMGSKEHIRPKSTIKVMLSKPES